MYAASQSWAKIATNFGNVSEEAIAATLEHSKYTVTSTYINRDTAFIQVEPQYVGQLIVIKGFNFQP